MKRKVVLLAIAAVIAAIGTSMVALYVNGVSDKATASEGRVKVLTATGQINAGESAVQAQAEGKFTLTEMTRSSVAAGALSSIDTLGDEVALAPIYPGEQILGAKFGTTVASQQVLPVPHGMVGISVELSDPGRVAGFVTPGSHVAIFATVNLEGGSEPYDYTRVLVSNVLVIGVGATTVISEDGGDAASGADSSVPKTVLTVALNQEDAEKVVFASNDATVAFGLLGKGANVTPDAGADKQSLAG